ncbi:hypothetical protein HZP16_08410 [Elizabethkingia anophelis]|nr:hypothetical protein [Elizabethkingia anophelis]
MKNVILCILFSLQFIHVLCQDKTELSKINKLLDSADYQVWKDPLLSLKYAKRASLEAEKSNNSEKSTEAYFYIARDLLFYGEFKEANIYIKKVMNEGSITKNSYYSALFSALLSQYYSRMHLFEKQKEVDEKALVLLDSAKDTNSLLLKSITYMALADYYTETFDYKSAHNYANRSIDLIEKIPQQEYLSAKEAIRYKAYIYYYKASIFLNQNNPDAAYPFIQKAYNQAISEGHHYITLFQELYGDYYYQIKDYQKALDFYLKAFENKKKFILNTNTAVALTTKIANTYRILGNKDKEESFFRLENQYRVFDEKVSTERMHDLLENIEHDHNTEKANIEFNSNMKITGIILVFIALIIIIIYYSKRKHRIINLKNKIQDKKIIEKEEEILNKQDEIRKLQLQTNESFNEILGLAKENSPHFWARFQEVYPEFSQNILLVSPNFKASELTFCAYIYLGFTTKEIAGYTFKAIKTIENNRYNIRKKLKLPPDEDLKLWLAKCISSEQ